MSQFSVHFCGTGNAFNADGYASQSIIITSAHETIAIDAGPTFLYTLQQNHIPPEQIDHILLTHLHGDHIAGIPFQVINFAINIRKGPLHITGPSGTRERILKLMEATYPDIDCEEWLTIRELDIAIKSAIPLTKHLTLDTWPMSHSPESLGYAISSANISIAITGDTRWNDAIIPLMHNRDLGIIECTTVEREPFAHISTKELAEHLPELHCRRVAVIHCDGSVRNRLNELNHTGMQVMKDGECIIL